LNRDAGVTKYTNFGKLPSDHHKVRARRCEIPHGNILCHMPTSGGISHYALGNTDAEHERLIRQAMLLAPLTERFFRQAGIRPAQRVFDLGSGVGDVAMLAARLVGSAGEVVGVERDTRSIARARTRVAGGLAASV
jgi:SAM-dependent methyltransferase